ncbi:MAG: acyltransferase [Clostridia bacterium]|nr:acyltransferase [Clostridia bacterium]
MLNQSGRVHLDRTVSNALRIFFELLVLFHHLYKPQTAFGEYISLAGGPVAVGGFMFFSGYGIGLSYIKDSTAYLKKLTRKRIPTTYLTIVVVNLFYLISFYLRGNSFDSAFSFIVSVLYLPVFKSFKYLSNWIYFLADLLIYYIVFVLLALIHKRKVEKLKNIALWFIVLAVILCITLSVLTLTSGNSMQMRGIFLFPLGLLFANGKEKITPFIKKHKFKLACPLFLLGVCLLIIFAQDYFYFGEGVLGLLCTVMIEYFVGPLIVLAIMIFCWGISLKCKFIDKASLLVLYVYVSHEFFFKSFQHLLPSLHWALIMLLTLFYAILTAIVIVIINTEIKAHRQRVKNKT